MREEFQGLWLPQATGLGCHFLGTPKVHTGLSPTSSAPHPHPVPCGLYLWDVDEQTGVGDIGDANESLLDDSLSLDLHTRYGGTGRQEQRGGPRAGMLSDVVDLLWSGKES